MRRTTIDRPHVKPFRYWYSPHGRGLSPPDSRPAALAGQFRPGGTLALLESEFHGEPLDGVPSRVRDRGCPPRRILDVDGTLVDTNYHHAIAWYRAFRQHGDRAARSGASTATSAWAATSSSERCAASETEEREGRRHPRRREGPLLRADRARSSRSQGARELIEDLKSRGHAVVLASSAKQDEVDHYLDLLDARELADDWTTSADVEATKPRARPGQGRDREGRHRRGGDGRRHDLGLRGREARRASETMAVLTGGFSEPELRDAGAVGVFDSIDELQRGARRDAACRQAQRAWPTGSAATRRSATSRRRPSRRAKRGEAGAGRPLRGPGAPRAPPALGPAPRARRHARVLGAAARHPGAPRREPARRAHRGPPARVPRVPRRDPEGRVRRRDDDDLGPRAPTRPRSSATTR